MDTIRTTITNAYQRITEISDYSDQPDTLHAINQTMTLLDRGDIQVAEKIDGQWHTHSWVKQAILLYFKANTCETMPGFSQFFDKVPMKYQSYSEEQLRQAGVRIVPPTSVRYGAHVASNTVLMPCFINIGARVDSGCMIDTWATVGSCAYIGKNVHLSGGAGIGGVLEPLQANPTIIEDNCFIGARSEIVEGVIVEKNAVISMGVFIGQSTPIYNRITDTVSYGRVPAGSVVIPGSLPSSNGKYNTNAAIIVKQVDAKTRSKTSINELLRGEL